MARSVLRGECGVAALVAFIEARSRGLGRPYVVAIDGRSGAGKSTLAAKLKVSLDAAVIGGDDFFAGGVDVRLDSPQDLARDCLDWRRQREVLEGLRRGRQVSYFAFDWNAFDGRFEAAPRVIDPHTVVILEGTYAARPELRDLLDLRVLLLVSDEARRVRLLEREGSLGPWELQWHRAEEWYFGHLAHPDSFDVILRG